MSETASSWAEANQRYIEAAVDWVRARVEWLATDVGHLELPDRREEAKKVLDSALQAASQAGHRPALVHLVQLFGLTDFEASVLLLGMAMEYDEGFPTLCALGLRHEKQDYPTFRLAMRALPGAHWSAVSPAGALRRHRLLELGPGPANAARPIRVAERILQYLVGVDYFDDRLTGRCQPISPSEIPELTSSQLNIARHIAILWSQIEDAADFPIIKLTGTDDATRRAIAATACLGSGRRLVAMPLHQVPRDSAELETFQRIWELENALSGSALIIEEVETDDQNAERIENLSWFAVRVLGRLILSGDEVCRIEHRPAISLEIKTPATSEIHELWRRAATPALAIDPKIDLDRLASQFHLGAPAIHAAVADALAHHQVEPDPRPDDFSNKPGAENSDDSAEPESETAAENEPETGTPSPGSPTGEATDSAPEQAADLTGSQAASEPATESDHRLEPALWHACRLQARPRLDDLAQRIDSNVRWDDLILDDYALRSLHDVVVHVSQRSTVLEKWGFADRGSRGLGTAALFAGSSGTGKTLAAEVLANELRLDLYRIDLATVVSKYIGETEKNLRKIFDAAETGGAILLFDEADALFGKRSEVRDSHDRYANIEVSYLLQRMEAYRGLAILTTNMKNALDTAFLRRLRFVVDFAFPDSRQRRKIWRQVFPPRVPLGELDFFKLAQLNVAGGSIKNIALDAAYLAAEAGEPVAMSHLHRAAIRELKKMGMTLSAEETANW